MKDTTCHICGCGKTFHRKSQPGSPGGCTRCPDCLDYVPEWLVLKLYSAARVVTSPRRRK